MDKLRVVIGTIYPYNESRVRGGVEAVALHLVHALAKRGDVELHVVSCNRAVRRDFTEKRGTVTFHWLATGQRLYGLRAVTVDAWRVRRIYDQIQPDVIHAQGFSEYAVACRPEEKMVLSVHGVEPLVEWAREDSHFAGSVGVYRLWIGRQIIRHSLRNASCIVSNAGEYIVGVLRVFLNQQTVVYIDNPLGDDFFPPWTEPLTGNPTVLYVGNIIARKRPTDLVRAFRQIVRWIPEARLHLLGPVLEHQYHEFLIQEIAKAGLESNVTHESGLTQATLKERLISCSVFALCSAQETAPMALLAAMAIGRPVVATRVGGIPWLVEDGSSGYLVDVGDVDAVAAHLVELLQDRLKRYQCGHRGREIAEERFRAERVAEQTLQTYRALTPPGRNR